MTKEKLTPTLVLTVICLAVALLLSGVNALTKDVILEQQNAETNKALLEVLPNGKNFEKINLDDYQLPSTLTEAYKAEGGYVFKLTVTGYKPGLVIMVGVDSEGKITGHKHIDGAETYGADDIIDSKKTYLDYTLDTLFPIEDVEIEASGTKTSQAYYNAIKGALESYTILTGGSVDLRTPEQILQDNCNAALGTADVKFTKWFATEVVTGVDAVYEAENNGGRVYVIGESFVAVKNGAVTTEGVSEENRAAVLNADAVISASTLTEITEKPSGVSKSITKIYATASGNYVFEAKAEGYEYAPSEIVLKVSISADGKIIDCLTVSHTESEGFGDKCQTEEYYDSWRGVEKDGVVISNPPITSDSTDPGAIAGATQTSNGYQKTVKRIFTAFELLTEGGND